MRSKTMSLCLFAFLSAMFIVLFPCCVRAELSAVRESVVESKVFSLYGVAYIYKSGSDPHHFGGYNKKEFVDFIRIGRNKPKVCLYWKESTEKCVYIGVVHNKAISFEFCLLPEDENDIKKIKDDPSQYKYEKGNIINPLSKKTKAISMAELGWIAVKPGQIIILKFDNDRFNSIAIRTLKLFTGFYFKDKFKRKYPKKYEKIMDSIWEMIYEYRYWPK